MGKVFIVLKKVLIAIGAFVGTLALLIALGVFVEFLTPPRFVNRDADFVNPLRIPDLLEGNVQDGRRVYELNLQTGESEFFAGQRTATWGANGSYLMPTLRAARGEQVEVRVTNNLGEYTTMHWHGMHVPATVDGVHQVITPGETWTPSWDIKQEAATLWYHPHIMGSTGLQVYMGLAGLFILDDVNALELDLPRNYGINDIPLIVQDRLFDSEAQFVYNDSEEDLYGHKGMHGDTLLVNGTYAPYAEVPAGLVRLRILNGSNARRYNFGFEDDREFFVIASDGGFLNAPVSQTRIKLSPAERAEILVDLSDLAGSADAMQSLSLMSYAVDDWSAFITLASKLIGVVRDEDQVFKVLELRPQLPSAQTARAQNTSTLVPETLNTIARMPEESASKTRRFVFGDDNTINNVKMETARIDEVVLLGSTEIWEVFNDTGQQHPFHIHDVQFQILDRDGTPPPAHEAGWKDTVNLDLHETVRLIMKFEDFSDPNTPYMYHCHTLEHEDHGMMGQFVVVSDLSVEPKVISEALDLGIGHENGHL